MIYTVTFNPAIDYVLHLTAPWRLARSTAPQTKPASLAARASMFPAFCGSLGAKASPLALQLAKLVPGWSAACSFPA